MVKYFSLMIFCVLSAVLAGTALEAQTQRTDALSAFEARMASSRTTFDYSFTIDDGRVKINGSGNVIVQGRSYYMAGNGLEVWCDGTTIWTSDVAAREVVIEGFGDSQTITANPAMLIGHLGSEFSWSGNGEPGTFNGQPAKIFRLKANGDPGIGDAVIYMDNAARTINGAEIKLPDGSRMTFVISAFLFSEAGPLSDFVPAEFPSGWIVTDLR